MKRIILEDSMIRFERWNKRDYPYYYVKLFYRDDFTNEFVEVIELGTIKVKEAIYIDLAYDLEDLKEWIYPRDLLTCIRKRVVRRKFLRLTLEGEKFWIKDDISLEFEVKVGSLVIGVKFWEKSKMRRYYLNLRSNDRHEKIGYFDPFKRSIIFESSILRKEEEIMLRKIIIKEMNLD